jgi:chromosome segregation ATPase
MDTLNVILLLATALALLFAFVIAGKVRTATEKASAADAARQAQEGKLSALRQELANLKEDNQRKMKALEEARENAKKRLRKDAQKGEGEPSSDGNASDSEVDRLKRTLSAMESQIRGMKEDADRGAQAIKAAAEAESQRELAKMQDAIEKLEDQLAQAKGESNRRRQTLSKQLAAPVDLTALPTEVVGELSRLFRKTEQHEKMHGILQGKYQLAQERYQELQRRYFAVCRELALVAVPNSQSSDEEAQQLAESVVQASDALSAQSEHHHAAPAERSEAPSTSEETPQ